MLQLLPKIQDAFREKNGLFTRNGLQGDVFVDTYMGQPIAPQEFEFTLPAVFVDHTIDWQQEIISVDAHVIVEMEEESGSPLANRDKGLDFLRSVALCRYIMTGLSTGFIGRLKPTTERPATTEYYHYRIITFEASINDYVNLDLVPPRLTDATGVTAVVGDHTIKQKRTSPPKPDLELYA